MNKVRDDLCSKRAEETRKDSFSLSTIGAMASNPYGVNVSYDRLRVTGEWNTKTVEDYVDMVKKELKKQHITVTPDIEKKMIAKMISDKIPKGSIDYIIQKAGKSTLFYLPTVAKSSPLEAHIEEQAEKAYNPSLWEKGAGFALGTTADIASTGGFGASWTTIGKMAVTDVALNVAADTAIPMIIAPGKEQEYLDYQKKVQQQKKADAKPKEEVKPETKPPDDSTESDEEQSPEEEEQTDLDLGGTWDDLIATLGLNGITDVGKNFGYILAMLPDMLVGMFTGKTKSVNIHDDMIPLASLVGGMFVKNPLLKAMMISYGGANLINKVGHEAMERHTSPVVDASRGYAVTDNGTKYKVYEDQELNPRVQRAMINGNRLIFDIDGIPSNVQLNEHIVGAYQSGCLPLNTLVNAIIANNDRVQQVATTSYEENMEQSYTRSRGI